MAAYNFTKIEKKWQKYWDENSLFKADIDLSKPKFYALDMFPYPSGSGLHVGHPLGYIATDIVARFKRLEGYNVLHPMGFDAFGLPAEQYAIQTGQHPAITTAQNIIRYKEQLRNIGFSFDWDKEVQTCDPDYYKWTQWITIQLFESWYDIIQDKARPIADLISIIESDGNKDITASCDDDTPIISSADWSSYNKVEQANFLLRYRLAYQANTTVNWCPALGTVLSNDEVKDGFSERGGFPVERRVMSQWNMRISAYAERLLQALEIIDWPEPMKEMQRNWIGKSIGAEFSFLIDGHDEQIKVFTTRIDTIFGVTYVALAPESDLIKKLTTQEQEEKVNAYVELAKNRSERERMSDVKTISGVFTGSYAIHPFTKNKLPIWIADYVLAGYGTGALMAVPAGDQRDYAFSKHFDLPIPAIFEESDISSEADPTKEGKMINSDFINGMGYQQATLAVIKRLEDMGIGFGKVQYKMRDAIYARQRYWGEPFPVYYKNNIATPLPLNELPLKLPEIDEYKPTEDGEPPLGRAKNWLYNNTYEYELSTMPGWAGSSWYFFRYMDSENSEEFVSKEAQAYWQNVDLYIGGSEHATGHLLYSRFWTKFLYDLDYVTVDEPFKKLVNQGMIQGRSNYVYAVRIVFNHIHDDFKHVHLPEIFVSKGLKEAAEAESLTVEDREYALSIIDYEVDKLNEEHRGLNLSFDNLDFKVYSSIHVDVNLVKNDILDIAKFKKWRPELANAIIIPERSGDYICGAEIEKMSKSKYNVVSPDLMIDKFGADTLRLYEMFLGPLEQFKPWNTNGIDGVYKFLKKLWRLYHDADGNVSISDETPTAAEFKVLHRAIKKTKDDIENLSLNTSVSSFMICVNELSGLKCKKRQILTDLCLIISPFAPHITEELWRILGNKKSLTFATYPEYNPEHMVENSFEYPIMINGKMRLKLKFNLNTPVSEIEEKVLSDENVRKWLAGKPPKKVIIVQKKIVNVVV